LEEKLLTFTSHVSLLLLERAFVERERTHRQQKKSSRMKKRKKKEEADSRCPSHLCSALFISLSRSFFVTCQLCSFFPHFF
jgi:hypothetical protein